MESSYSERSSSPGPRSFIEGNINYSVNGSEFSCRSQNSLWLLRARREVLQGIVLTASCGNSPFCAVNSDFKAIQQNPKHLRSSCYQEPTLPPLSVETALIRMLLPLPAREPCQVCLDTYQRNVPGPCLLACMSLVMGTLARVRLLQNPSSIHFCARQQEQQTFTSFFQVSRKCWVLTLKHIQNLSCWESVIFGL